MSKQAVIGVYDNLAKAEKAELDLEEAQLPVGQMSLIEMRAEARKNDDDITAHEVAETLAASGIQLAKGQVAEYGQALKEGKLLLLFRGGVEEVARAYHTLGNTDNDDLTVLAGPPQAATK